MDDYDLPFRLPDALIDKIKKSIQGAHPKLDALIARIDEDLEALCGD